MKYYGDSDRGTGQSAETARDAKTNTTLFAAAYPSLLLSFLLRSQMEPVQRFPFDDMKGCVRLSGGLDGIVWIIDNIIALKTPIEYDISSCQLTDSAIAEYSQENQESHESIEWEKEIFTLLDTKGSSHFIKSYFHAKEGIFMEYVQGRNLSEHIKTNASMDFMQKFHVISQLIAVVAELAQLGLAHGDLRPENFLLDSSGHIKCCDFAATVQLGKPYRRIPWPLYIKPVSSDVIIADEPGQAFSIALSIYFVVTGHRPYHDKQLHEAVNLFREESYPATDGDDFKSLLPVGEILRKCWHGEYTKITALKADIETAGRALGIRPNADPSLTLFREDDLQCRRHHCEEFLRRKGLSCSKITRDDCKGAKVYKTQFLFLL
jgi:serine/threonine protein kinase